MKWVLWLIYLEILDINLNDLEQTVIYSFSLGRGGMIERVSGWAADWGLREQFERRDWWWYWLLEDSGWYQWPVDHYMMTWDRMKMCWVSGKVVLGNSLGKEIGGGQRGSS